ncbi:hypothetical protein [Nostoc sp. FACHB-190]|uniref:hypothetical protein n=1 Tax=Nostoc sp. FACHB-190 TaxID=2692838 RepID=UPI001689A395|nr:hypothetical protein [Nostoc sp. FACHB-190]MBD2303763.1 hypothetical protein [Nostoc sp. FACHB-190]
MPLTNPNTTALQKANNLSDLANAASAWLNLGAAQSIGANGWTRLPSGLLLQWQTVSIPSQPYTGGLVYFAVTPFPVAFNTVYAAFACQSGGSFNNNGFSMGFSTTQSTISYQFSSSVNTSISFRVFSIGI